MGFRHFLSEFLAVSIMLYGLAGIVASGGAYVALSSVLSDPAFMQGLLDEEAPAEAPVTPEAQAEAMVEERIGAELETRLLELAGRIRAVAAAALGFIGLLHAMFFLTGLTLVLHKQRLDEKAQKR